MRPNSENPFAAGIERCPLETECVQTHICLFTLILLSALINLFHL